MERARQPLPSPATSNTSTGAISKARRSRIPPSTVAILPLAACGETPKPPTGEVWNPRPERVP